MHAEAGRLADRMGRFGGSDQQFARHAADPRASRAVRPAFNQHGALAERLGGPECGQAGSAGTNDCDIDLQFVHAELLCNYRAGNAARNNIG